MVHFIVNPTAGTKSLQKRALIMAQIQSIPNSKIWLTERTDHATELTQKAIKEGAKRIIVIGGDGTINEVASALLHSTIPLGIIPQGSGNGLARHLEIPFKFDQALHRALNGQILTIDAGLWNKRPFFCTAGIGFDAYVAAHFAQRGKRGFINYIYSTLQSFRQYQPIVINETEKVFSITIANANQFGNNAYISPESELFDGYLECIRINPAPIFTLGILGIRLFRKNLNKSNLAKISSVKNLSIRTKVGLAYHLDGESLILDTNEIEISILPASLLVIK
jgi:YegS/Rv2252/BmrU family lipid kinase